MSMSQVDQAEIAINRKVLAQIGERTGLDEQQALDAVIAAGSAVLGCLLASQKDGGSDPVASIEVRGNSDSFSSVDARSTVRLRDLI